ncbi:TOMM precursor leader peptide-binding protein [Nitrospirillum viridazoti]|uniref:Ribosomal protein S12 methylthiotransferase accessory factor n=3 Tax=Nitrospirillum TaxID=1543705 RepID=A0A560IK35_9PROT|nr:TOMM precursor leader peptide-binding protein [Nitrospirillum amazonense]TWB59398.1 ribosomal protein S12 methylthiotransferase accessory factor [Nitrospirillum amazonense]
MLRIPLLKAHLQATVFPGEGVLLLSEDGGTALHGAAYEGIVPLLDGRHTTDAIVDALAGRVDAARVYYVLGLLERAGHLVEAAPDQTGAEAAYWHAAGVDAPAARHALAARRVAVIAVGPADAGPLRAALVAAGLQEVAADGADLWIVAADDYLHPELAAINAAALASDRPWLLLRTGGREQWLGPHFVPHQTGCWCCLQRRLARNRALFHLAADRQGRETLQPVQALLPAVHAATCQNAVAAAALILAGAPCGLTGRVLSLDLTTLAQRAHVLARHPACPACGKAPVPVTRPLELHMGTAAFRSDGGHRSVAPETTLATYGHLVSPITGVVCELERAGPAGESLTHVYTAGTNAARPMESLNDLKRNLRSNASGKGVSEAQAKASALCEAIERYSGELSGGEVRIPRAWRDWDVGQAIHPNAVMRYSDAQFADRAAQNARGSAFNVTPHPLPDDAVIDWTPVWSLTEQRHRHLPTQLLYYNVRGRDAPDFYAVGCSNGSAAGNTREEAILQGFFELVERDAAAIWWYNRLARPAVAVEGFGDPYLTQLRDHYRDRYGREVWALDLTTDLGIPVFVALSRQVGTPAERILMGMGCHLDARIALQRAFAEMNQLLGLADDGQDAQLEEPDTVAWLTGATVANQPYLAADGTRAPVRLADFPVQHTGGFLADIDHCLSILDRAGLEMLVLDQTRADVSLPVVKVVVPGLRHYWARFGPGRLYDVPVRMGWLDRPLAESDLNPIPIFM